MRDVNMQIGKEMWEDFLNGMSIRAANGEVRIEQRICGKSRMRVILACFERSESRESLIVSLLSMYLSGVLGNGLAWTSTIGLTGVGLGMAALTLKFLVGILSLRNHPCYVGPSLHGPSLFPWLLPPPRMQ